MSMSFTKDQYIEDIKFQLTGGVLDLEIDNKGIGRCIDQALIELQRYIDETKLITVPFSRVIDLKDFKHSSIVKVYRSEGLVGDTTVTQGGISSNVDPMYAQTWMTFSNGLGGQYNLQSYLLNYLSYNTLLQMRSNMSTDLSFKEDKHADKLYINVAHGIPTYITIEYVPIFQDVEEVTSDYWIDILKRMSLAITKVALGRIRTRFTQSNALWTQDGERMLEEGNTELKELRETLKVNSSLFYPID